MNKRGFKYLRNYTYTQIYSNKNKIIKNEFLIFADDFLILRLRNSDYLKIDVIFHFPKDFKQFLIIMYYDSVLERYIPSFYNVTNNKKECCYDLIFINVTRLINMGFSKIKYLKTITTDNEIEWINSVKKYFPNIVRISCWFYLKNNLEKKTRILGLKRKENLEITKKVINSLGILPAIYNGDLKDLNDKLDKLKIKYKNYSNFIDDFLGNNIEYFKDGSLEYSKFPAHIRTISVLENYNGFFKSELGKKKRN